MLHLGKTSYNDLVFTRGEFLRLVEAENESLWTYYFNILYVHILIYDKNNFARVTTESIKPVQRLDLGKASYND